MKKIKTLNSADLLIEISKKINIRKYLKRQTIDLQGKTIKVLRDSSILKADLSVHNFQIKVLREHLHKTAEVILKKNGLTINDISVEDFELGSTDLITWGSVELMSKDNKKTYFYNIILGEIVPYTTPEDKIKANSLVISTKPVPNLMDYIQFLNLPPF